MIEKWIDVWKKPFEGIRKNKWTKWWVSDNHATL